MTEHHGARFLPGQFLQLARHNLAHATKPFDVPGTGRSFQCHPAADRLRAFGHDNNGVLVAVTRCPTFDMLGDLGNVVGDFGNEDRIRPARNAGMERQPSRIPAHYFDHHHPP